MANKIPAPIDFLLKTSLYQKVDFTEVSDEEYIDFIREIVDPISEMETICVSCRKDRVFRSASSFETVSPNHELRDHVKQIRNNIAQLEKLKQVPASDDIKNKIQNITNTIENLRNRIPGHLNNLSSFSVQYSCSKDYNHSILFVLYAHERTIMKIGQYPSFADLSEPEVQKYRRLLGEEKFREFTRALGLFAHGIGVGSFVYLRRIFEHLLDEAHNKAKQSDGWKEEKFISKRVDKKIELLRDYLPPFVVKNKKLYSILSVGVHTLSDQECMDNFPLVRAGIELILDEEIRRREEEDKVQSVEKELGELIKKLS